MKVRIELEDGQAFQADANPKTFMGLASKSAFKRQFGVPATVLTLLSEAFVETGEQDENGEQKTRMNPDLTSEQLRHVDEEYVAFLVWTELGRRCPEMPKEPWDKAVERIVSATFDAGDEPDPTPATST